MTGKEAIKDIMWEKRVTQATLGERIGSTNPSTVGGFINRGVHDMRTDILVKLANAMGCKVIIRDPSTGKEWNITC